VGEVLAAIPLIAEIRRKTPRTKIFVSTTTLAGRETADKRLAALTEGVFYAPFDFVWCVRRVLRHIRPTVVVILETEIWPNLFRESKRIGCGLVIVNGRISDRAVVRYKRFSGWFAPVLAQCDRILVQSAEMKARFEAAGAQPDRVEVGGNLKYDVDPPAIARNSAALRFIEADRERPLWIAASTSADDSIAEEDSVIAAQTKLPGWRLIIAPRKPERFESVARLLAESGLHVTRRSAADFVSDADILLLDSVGELSGLFPYATAVFMGGTLADKGGHNILEPAIFGKPIIAGPHMENFREIGEHFERHRAVRRIDSGEELAAAVLSAAADPALGERAREAAAAKRGAALRAAAAIMELYESRYPCDRHPQPSQAILWLLSLLWKEGSKRDRESKRKRAECLPVPVVSVGNVTAGGTGKTPVTIELLRDFRADGAGLLMRGYGRVVRENVVVLDEHHHPPVSSTGDEAQLCMRATGVPIGIGPDRRAAGMQLLNASPARILFLDDGFQHMQLKRDFDLVLIDALHPFGGGELLPLGRLREPLEGLARASAFLITRSDEAPNIKAIETILHRYNPTAPIFAARTVACGWREADGSEFDIDLFAELAEDMRAIAFCGLGNPDAFWHTLRQVGIDPVASYAFDDHHQYTPSEIRRLARHARDIGAGSMLTTAKDVVNLDPEFPAIIGAIKLYWLEVRTEIEDGTKLIDLIRQATYG
jgi:3-deoxy-D-manno-octulosonic-acid transferase